MASSLVVLQKSLIDLIDYKAGVECGQTALLYASTYVSQLNDHISGVSCLSNIEIEHKVDYLAGCLTLTLDMPMQDLEVLRARPCNSGNFSNAQELSYIKETTDSFPSYGRLNQTGQAIFYGAIAIKQDDTALRVVLSEAGAKTLDSFNVLRSHQKLDSDLNLRMIGVWDHVRRNERPYYLNEENFEYYTKTKKYMESKFSSDLLKAYELTDRFFADILSRQGSKELYQVTSAISAVFLNGTHSDGVLYSSVAAKGEPVVAIKPQAIDSKFEHQFVSEVKVEQCFGYEFYQYKTLGLTSSIDPYSNRLMWE
ncbi:hypothetical protein [Vibrio sp. 10N.222.52.C12]|uniref:hypothetical protein n=1 Tax=Vibrio sp. 10N.222.52.C12 TaxID=3229630 RepID=UPI003551CEA7